MMSVFITSMDGIEDHLFARFGNCLARLGLKTENREKGLSLKFGIVLFKSLDGETLRFIHHSIENGKVRIIAVPVDHQLNAGDSWSLIEAGAADVIHFSDIEKTSKYIKARIDRWHEVDRMMDSPWISDRVGGTSRVWRKKIREFVETAGFTRLSVLLMGESGTGKELVANLVHEFDPRKPKGGFVVLDCTTIMPELSGSEFFGHERGAFTGAVVQRDGAFALANNGTLFLDEIGELPLQLQAQLLRVIQEKSFKR
jgi:transcriptional regulator with PAS, ATPase and Fis domain